MRFINPAFAWFFLFLALPLLLSIRFRVSRKKADFPSLQLLDEIMLRQKRPDYGILNQLLRLIILALLVLAAMGPYRSTQQSEYDLVIDDSVSMSVQPLPEIISALLQEYRIRDIYFGTKAWDRDTSLPQFRLESEPMEHNLRKLNRSTPLRPLLLLTDGQTYQFPPDKRLNTLPGGSQIYLLPNTNRNAYVSDFSMLPPVALDQEKNEFLIRLGGELQPQDRVQVLINDQEVLSMQAVPEISLSRFISSQGLSFGEVRLSGDSFAADNRWFFTVLKKNTPRVYLQYPDSLQKKILQTLFPRIRYVSDPATADICVVSRIQDKSEGKYILLTPDNRTQFEQSLRELGGGLAAYNPIAVRGRPVTQEPGWDALNYLGELSLVVGYPQLPGYPRVQAGETNLISHWNGVDVLHFSLQQNRDSLDNHLFLLFYLSQSILTHWLEETVLFSRPVNTEFLDESNRISQAETPGIYRVKSDQRFLVVNAGQESRFQFLNSSELQKRMPAGVKVQEYHKDQSEHRSFTRLWSMVLAGVALILLIIQIILNRY